MAGLREKPWTPPGWALRGLILVSLGLAACYYPLLRLSDDGGVGHRPPSFHSQALALSRREASPRYPICPKLPSMLAEAQQALNATEDNDQRSMLHAKDVLYQLMIDVCQRPVKPGEGMLKY